MLGGMTTALLVANHHVNVILAALIGTGVGLALGLVLSQGLYWPQRRYPELAILAASFAVVLIIETVANNEWGANPRVTPTNLNGTVHIAGAYIPETWLIIVGAAIVFVTAIHLFVRYTTPGRAMRAMSLNRTAALLVGIPVRKYSLMAFGIGSAVAGAAGALYSLAFGVSSTMGSNITLDAFIVIIFAGVGSVFGAFWVGLLLGVVESFGGRYISTGYQDMFGFVFLVVILVARPEGLFHRGASKE
jgi:branched-chain amino acid transport system permease protein